MSINFNEISADTSKPKDDSSSKEDVLERSIRTGERTRFIHKPNPLVDRAYQIFEYNVAKGSYDVVGDYVLISKEEPRDITEKKIINLMSILNKKDELIDLSSLTNKRVLFTLVPEAQAGDQTKMIFKDYDGSGVSKDNAVFTIRKGVLK